jgi:hypothetical protein
MSTTEGVIDPPKSFTEVDISARFKEFGGIFRHVFANPSSFRDRLALKQSEIASQDARALLEEPNVERTSVSHFICCYVVKEDGPLAYQQVDFDL